MTHSAVDGAHSGAYKGSVPASARLVLMGALEFQSSGVTVPLPLSAQRVLAFMGLRRGPLSRLYVAGQLWLDSTEERASASLRSALWRLNRAAGEVVSATGRGLVYLYEEAAPECGLQPDGTRFAVQGYGNVGSWAARLMQDYERDLADSVEVTLDLWRRRPVWEKLVGPFVWILERQQ